MNELEALYTELEAAFRKSHIKKYATDNQHKWYYSLLATPAHKNAVAIVGFNWGASSGREYEKQLTEPTERGTDLGSLKRTIPYLKKYFHIDTEEDKLVQTNFCFFRSATEAQIVPEDIDLCKPILGKLLAYLQPSVVLSFSVQFRRYLEDNGQLSDVSSRKILTNKGEYTVTSGTLNIEGTPGVRIHFLPHPNYPLRKEYREKCWESVAQMQC